MKGWKPLTEVEYREVWDRFYDQFAFRPSVSPSDWPSIREPDPSLTFRFSYEDARTKDNYDEWVLAVLREVTGSNSAVYALDWQHESYWFYPHLTDHFEIPPFPDGEYYIFLTPDFLEGLFGHPWEQTICIFGEHFLSAAKTNAPNLFSTVHRKDGIEPAACATDVPPPAPPQR